MNITFTYDNGELIHLLQERGELIKEDKFEEVKKVEAKINELKNKDFKQFTRPVAAFVTLENEEAY